MAFDSARPIRQWKTWPEIFERFLECLCLSQGGTNRTRNFISVLMLYRNYGASEVKTAVEPALEHNISSSEGVCHLLIYTNEAEHFPDTLNSWERLPAEVRLKMDNWESFHNIIVSSGFSSDFF